MYGVTESMNEMAEIRKSRAGATPVPWTRGNRLLGFDLEQRRLWVAGQRLHHGATGIALALAGIVLTAHDWKDRSLWFRRGRQSD